MVHGTRCFRRVSRLEMTRRVKWEEDGKDLPLDVDPNLLDADVEPLGGFMGLSCTPVFF